MSVQIRGYRWVMDYRGFEIYTRSYNGHTFAVMSSDSVAAAAGAEVTQFECYDGDAYLTAINEFWAEYGL